MAAKKKAKKQAAKKKNVGMRELLDLLEDRPHLVRALLVDHAKVRRLLKTKEARRLLPDVNAPPPERGTIEGDNSIPSYPQVILRCLKRSI